MAKNGFGGQWIEIFRAGKHTDSGGTTRNYDRKFLEKVVANFNSAEHEPPVVVGHPQDNTPAFGWTRALRINGDALEAQFGDTDDEFETLVRDGKFRKRSAAFYLDEPALRHVGFLGAQPPALKGLREIQFNDGDQSPVEIFFNEGKIMSNEKEAAQEETRTFKEWMKEFFGGGAQQPAPANFTETNVKNLIAEAVQTAKAEFSAEFSEKLTAKDAQIETLTNSVNAISSTGKRAEITQFVESIPAESGKYFLKRAGVVEFLESCAIADAADKEPAVVCFSEDADGKKEEVKISRLEWAKDLLSALPKFIEFGESFGNLKATNKADEFVSPQELADLRAEMGVKAAAGGEK